MLDERATCAQSKKLEAEAGLKGEGGGERTWTGVARSRSPGEGETSGLGARGFGSGEKVCSESWLLLQPLNSSS